MIRKWEMLFQMVETDFVTRGLVVDFPERILTLLLTDIPYWSLSFCIFSVSIGTPQY